MTALTPHPFTLGSDKNPVDMISINDSTSDPFACDELQASTSVSPSSSATKRKAKRATDDGVLRTPSPPGAGNSSDPTDDASDDSSTHSDDEDDGIVRFDGQDQVLNRNKRRTLIGSTARGKRIKLMDDGETEAQTNAEKEEEERMARLERQRQVEIINLSSSDDDDDVQEVGTKKGWQPWVQKNAENQARIAAMASMEQPKPSTSTAAVSSKRSYADDWVNYTVTEGGAILLNPKHPPNEPDVTIAAHLTHKLKPHQISGIRFLYDNIIESPTQFSQSKGFGCVLAHSMGLGKTMQVVTFTDLLLRHTTAKHVLVIVPKNVLTNWQVEFDQWLPEQPTLLDPQSYRQFSVFTIDDAQKTNQSRREVIMRWHNHKKAVLLMGYEMFRRLITLNQPKKKKGAPAPLIDLEDESPDSAMASDLQKALINPGPDVIVCDEGHKIKEEKTEITKALKRITTMRRIVMTGYPLQNNLEEYYCMIDFVRPGYLGSRRQFRNVFMLPIVNGMCHDSTEQDVKLARMRTHVLCDKVKGFVMRRSHLLLKAIVPQNHEYVIMCRKSPLQSRLYRTYVKHCQYQIDAKPTISGMNVLDAFAMGSKIWNHPDVLYNVMKEYRRTQEDYVVKHADSTTLSRYLDAPVVKTERMDALDGFPSDLHAPGGPLGDRAQTSALMRQMALASASTSATKNGKPVKRCYEWAEEFIAEFGYTPDRVDDGYKMSIGLSLIRECVQRGHKILLYSQSLQTLDVVERMLAVLSRDADRAMRDEMGVAIRWRRDHNYFRMEGVTKAKDRNHLVEQFNTLAQVKLFLISTKAGSLGINLTAATRVIVFDASWNPCHDAQAVCRIYRYGQINQTFIYRLVADNCMEQVIFSRQITKRNMFRRVIDEKNSNVLVTKDELDHLFKYDVGYCRCKEKRDAEPSTPLNAADFESSPDEVLNATYAEHAHKFAKAPFLHDTLMQESSEQLSDAEKREAQNMFMHEVREYMSSGEFTNPKARPHRTYLPDGTGLASQGLVPPEIRLLRQQQMDYEMQMRQRVAHPLLPVPTQMRFANGVSIPSKKPDVMQITTNHNIRLPLANNRSGPLYDVPVGQRAHIVHKLTSSGAKNTFLRLRTGEIFDATDSPYSQVLITPTNRYRPTASNGVAPPLQRYSNPMASLSSTANSEVILLSDDDALD